MQETKIVSNTDARSTSCVKLTLYVIYGNSSKQVIIEEKQQRHRASITTTTAAAAVDDLTSRLADPMVARYTNASPTLLAAPAHAAQQQLLLQHQRHHQRPASSLLRKPKENEEGFIASFSNWLSTTWDRCMDHMSSKPQRPLVIERPAKHECEAAGKMHQIFEEVRSCCVQSPS